MTAAHYEAYGAIDALEAEVARARHQIEKDHRGRRITVDLFSLRSLLDDFEDAVTEWEEEDEAAPTVDETASKAVTP